MCLYRYHYSLYKEDLGIKVYYLKPDILIRVLRKVATEIFDIDWYQNELFRRLVPYSDYYLHSAEKFAVQNQNMPLNIIQVSYLEKSMICDVKYNPYAELKKRVLLSLEREFENQKLLLDLLCDELYDESWSEWLDRSYDVIMSEKGNRACLIQTNGQWKKREIKALLESC